MFSEEILFNIKIDVVMNALPNGNRKKSKHTAVSEMLLKLY